MASEVQCAVPLVLDPPTAVDAFIPSRVRVFGTPDSPAHGLERDGALAEEVPVAMVFNGISHAVMMSSPANLEVFALGFALSEGILASVDECRGVEVFEGISAEGLRAFEVHLDISSRRFEGLKERRRQLAGRTGCGVCGIESLDALELVPPTLPELPWQSQIDHATVTRAMQALPQRQLLNARVESVHAAGWAGLDGVLQDVMEDVGRHNALDKLIGQRARAGLLAEPGFVVLSSRASHELVGKCARAGWVGLATISAPTALGVRAAQLCGLRLWGMCRSPKAILYAEGGAAQLRESRAATLSPSLTV